MLLGRSRFNDTRVRIPEYLVRDQIDDPRTKHAPLRVCDVEMEMERTAATCASLHAAQGQCWVHTDSTGLPTRMPKLRGYASIPHVSGTASELPVCSLSVSCRPRTCFPRFSSQCSLPTTSGQRPAYGGPRSVNVGRVNEKAWMRAEALLHRHASEVHLILTKCLVHSFTHQRHLECTPCTKRSADPGDTEPEMKLTVRSNQIFLGHLV